MGDIPEDIKKTAAWIAAHRMDLRTAAGVQITNLIEEALRDERQRSLNAALASHTSALEERDARIAKLEAALERIANATPRSTNSGSANEAFAFCAAVAETALGKEPSDA